MKEYNLQNQICDALHDGEWRTVREVSERVGRKPSSTIRCILDTLAFAGALDRSWGYVDQQRALYYRFCTVNNKEGRDI